MEEKKGALTRRIFMDVTLLGAVTPLSVFAAAQSREWTSAEKANVKVVADFCAAWSTRDIAKPLAFLSPDCVYRMTETMPTVVGHEGVIQRLKSYVDATERLEYQVLDTFASGPVVMNHRIDRYVSTSQPLTWEGVGIFFVQNGKIKEWSDYTISVSR